MRTQSEGESFEQIRGIGIVVDIDPKVRIR